MIVGTAGHVDHGKTTLVRALTGIDTDRLKEEKARGISIDLGFAYLAGPDGANIGFIDVPGHERLVRTMVAGAAAIDFALLVVAADDGIMPQTREHLDVLDLLALTRGIIVVTKCDRVDADRRAAVAAEIASATAKTGLAGLPTVFVAATTGEGIEPLRLRLLDEAAQGVVAQPTGAFAERIFRMSVDRAFTLTGVGTVAAGTALAGAVAVEDEVMVLPQRIRARVRSLHAQNRTAVRGVGGERCALALAGTAVSRDAVGRGVWICGERNPRDSARLDAEVSLLPGEHKPLGQWSPVSFHCGASAVQGRVVVLSESTLAPGHKGFAQIVLDTALPLRHGDRFVLRDPGAGRTLGGGCVLDPRAPVRRRRAPDRLARLSAMRPTDPAIALGALLATGPGLEDLELFASDRGLTDRARDALLAPLARLDTSKVIVVATPERLLALETEVAASLAAFHADHPDQPGVTAERMRLMLVRRDSVPLPKPLFTALVSHLAARRQIVLQGPWMLLPGHVVQLAAEEQRVAAALTPLLEAERFRPPRVRDLANALNLAEPLVRRTCKALARSGDLVEIAHDHFFLRATVAEMASCARSLSEACPGGVFSAADFRDRLDNGRKVAIQILEFFDRHGLTQRVGDLRRAHRAADHPWGADD